MPFELQIALRYLLAKRKQAFISVISFISTLGVAVGVMAVVVALAIMTGLQQELQDRILGSNAHVYVFKASGISDYRADVETLRRVPGVLGAAPAILGRGLALAARGNAPVQVKGIDPALEPQVSDFARAIQSGNLNDLAPSGDGRPDGIFLGKDLATTLDVTIGDSLTLLTPQGTLSPMGMIPRSPRLRVAGTFSLGLYEFDSSYGFVSIEAAKRLFRKDAAADYIQLRVDDITRAPRIAESISGAPGSAYMANDWTTMNRPLFSALWLEKVAVSLAIGLIVMVAALNIVATLILLVMDKNRDIAILKTMGASARSVTTIFVLQGLIIGIVGTAVGAGLGYAVSHVCDRYKLIRMSNEVYQVPYLPFKVLWPDFALVVVSAILICLVATIYPSRQAARLDPAQALRYE